MPVEPQHQLSEPVGDRPDQRRILGERVGQSFDRHDPGQVFEHSAAVTRDQPHPLGQMGVQILEREKVELLDLRPGIPFEVVPARDRSMGAVGPLPFLGGPRRSVRSDLEPARQREHLFEPDKIISHPVPEGDEVVEVHAEAFPVGDPGGRAVHPDTTEQIAEDGFHDHVIHDVLDERNVRRPQVPAQHAEKAIDVRPWDGQGDHGSVHMP